MHPVLSIGSYTVISVIILLFAESDLRIWRRRSRLIWWGTGAAAILYILFGALPVFGALLPDSPLKFFLEKAGNLWLGFFLYFGMLMLFSRPLAVLLKRPDGRGGNTAAVICTACFFAAVIIFAYGTYHAQQTTVKKYDVRIGAEANQEMSLRIVLLADFHLSVNSNLEMTEKMVEMVNAEDADVILIAGDIFTSSYYALKDPDGYAAALRGMKSRYGVYAVYGNHDVEETLFGGFPITPVSQAFRSPEMENFFEKCGFRVLYDEVTEIAEGSIQIVGRADGDKAGDGTAVRMSAEEVLSGTDPAKPVIVLEHEPREFAELKAAGADLALCGHTHAGQVFPGNLIVPFFNENGYGYKVIDGLATVVTSGIGYYGPPMRVGTNSEITVINVEFG